jgi:hypothetical protein
MKSALAFPFNDPDGTMFHHLQVILPDLKNHFERAYICPPLSTQRHVDHMQMLQADDFFTIFPASREMQVGEHFAYLYQHAAEAASPNQLLHLCYLDQETQKRLRYVLPMIDTLTRLSINRMDLNETVEVGNL